MIQLPANQFSGRRLYYAKHGFILTFADNSMLSISEPQGWDKIALNLTFDKTLRGFKFEFSDKDLTLKFDAACGFEQIRAAYNQLGINAYVNFKFGEYSADGTTFTVLYESLLDWSTYIEDKYQISISCLRQSIAVKLNANWTTSFELERLSTLRGVILQPLQKYPCLLYPVTIDQNALMYLDPTFVNNDDITEFSSSYQDEGVSTSSLLNGSHLYTWVPPYIQGTNGLNGIDNFSEPTSPEGELLYAGSSLPTGISKITMSLRAMAKIGVARSDDGSFYNINYGMVIYKKSAISAQEQDDFVTHGNVTILWSGNRHLANVTFQDDTKFDSGQLTFDLMADESLFIKFYTDTLNCQMFIYRGLYGNINPAVMNADWNLTVAATPIKTALKFQSTKVFDALNRALAIVLDNSASFKSDFFSTGWGRNHILSAGSQLRNNPHLNQTTTLQQMLLSLSALMNLGASCERDDYGNEWFRFEPLEYFFRNVELIVLTTISNYSKQINTDNTFNDIIFNFNKTPQNGESGTSIEFLTQLEFITPISTYSNKMQQTIKFTMASSYIDNIMQNQYVSTETSQFDTDADQMLIAVNDISSVDTNPNLVYSKILTTWNKDTKTITFFPYYLDTDNNPQPIPNFTFPLSANETFSLTSVDEWTTPKTFTTLLVSRYYKTGWGTVYDVVVTDKTMNYAASTAVRNVNGLTMINKIIPQANEEFDLVTGIPHPESTYNLIHHLKIVLKRWTNQFLGSLNRLQNDTSINNQLSYVASLNNNTLITHVKDGSEYVPPMDISAGNMNNVDNGNELLTNLNRSLFGRNTITFQCPMNWDTLRMLQYAFEGHDPNGKNYGYFTILNPRGDYESGYLQDLSFDPNQQIAKITLIEKYNGV